MTPSEKKIEPISWHTSGTIASGSIALAPRLAAPTFPSQMPARDLRDYFALLRARPILLSVCAGVGLLLGLLASLAMTPSYRARAAIQIERPNLDFLSTKQVNPIADEVQPTSSLTDLETQLKIISSSQLSDRTINKLVATGRAGPLINEATKSFALRRFLFNSWHIGKSPTQDDLADAIRTIVAKNLVVKQLGPSKAVEVMFSFPDRNFAVLFTNSLVDEYANYSMEDQRNTGRRTVSWLTSQLDDTRQRLQQSATAVQDYATQSGLLFINQPSGNSAGLGTDISGTKLAQIQAELSHAEDDRVATQSHNDIAQSASPEQLSDALSDPHASELHAKITDLERERAELLTTYTENNDRVRRVDAQLVPLLTAYHSLQSALQHRVASDYKTALRREQLLTATYKNEAAVVTDRANKAIQYNILKRELESNQQQYDALLVQVKQANIASEVKISPIRIFDPARAPIRPTSPDVPVNAAVGLAGGLLTGVFLSLARTKNVRTLYKPGTLQPATELRELGVIPRNAKSLRTQSQNIHRIHARSDLEVQLSCIPQAQSQIRHQTVELVAWSNKEGIVAEAFRALLTSVIFSENAHKQLKVLVFTSARPLEGKTTLTCNLAISMAALGRRVLLIDADLRKPRLHNIFDLENNVGLSTLLQVPSALREVKNIIQDCFVPNLSILTSGPTDFASGILLQTGGLAELLGDLRNQFDTILIDTPPTLLTADARMIGNKADAVLLVTRAGQTSSEDAMSINKLFKEDGTFVLGSIFNDYSLPNLDHSYYYTAS